MSSSFIKQKTCIRLPTDAGEFQLCLYHSSEDENKDHLALIMGDVAGGKEVLVRVHSECYTGDVLGSLRCDCGPQLHRAMHLIAHEGEGVLVYLRQEGRGIGLLDKLRAYNLQDEGYDTVDANLLLGHAADARDYTVAALILQDLGVNSLRLLTNNPSKIASMEQCGLPVTARVPLQLPPNDENLAYLETKVMRMQHLLNLEGVQPTAATDNGEHPPAIAPNPAIVIGPAPPQRPFVTLSFAQSLDGSITAEQGEPMALSGPQAMHLTHQLRARHDGILVGVNTVLADNPQLNVRHVRGGNPQPIIVDSRLRFPQDAVLLDDAGRSPWIVTTAPADPARQAALRAHGATIIIVPANAQGQVDLKVMLAELKQRGLNSLMVEGGAQIITSFLADRLVDRLVLTVAPLLVGGLNAVQHLGQVTTDLFPRLANLHTQQLGQDMVLSGDVVWE